MTNKFRNEDNGERCKSCFRILRHKYISLEEDGNSLIIDPADYKKPFIIPSLTVARRKKSHKRLG